MTKITFSILLAGLFLFQGALSNAAEPDSGSFFHRTRKAEQAKKAQEPPPALPAPVETPAVLQTEEAKQDSSGLAVPPTAPSQPNKGYVVMNAPRAPYDIPSPPKPIPSAPKAPPKAPSIPK